MQRSILAAVVLATWSPAIALDCVDWSGTMLPPTPINGVEPGEVISAGDWLIVAGNSLQVCDTSIPAAPVVIGTTDLPEPPGRLRWHDGTVYLVCGASGIFELDLADPTSPVVSSVFQSAESVVDVAFTDDLAVVVTAEGVLYTLRRNPQREMTLVGSLDTGLALKSVAVTGDAALVGAYSGLLPVSIADPEAPLSGDVHLPSLDYSNT